MPELPDIVNTHITSNEAPSASDLPMLRKYRLSLDPYLTRHISGALSPLRRLPLEILQVIFLRTLALSGEPHYTWFDVFDREDPLWTVRRVCRKWRTATHYPPLWTGLRI